MIIRNFDQQDINPASQIAHLTWGNFYCDESFQLQKVIYDFMVTYYDLNRKLSFCAIEEDELKGFILSGEKHDKNNCYIKLQNQIKNLQNTNDQKIALDLFAYLETCGNEVKSLMNNNDIFIGLFVSIQKGCGKLLLEKLVQTCKLKGIKNIYLWTDTTCDYKYYQKNNFILVKNIKNTVNNKNIETLIYKKTIQ